jgi:hypothetical protein
MNLPIPSRPSLRTLSLSATGPRTIQSILSATCHPGAGCYKRIYLFEKNHPVKRKLSGMFFDVANFIKQLTIPDIQN